MTVRVELTKDTKGCDGGDSKKGEQGDLISINKQSCTVSLLLDSGLLKELPLKMVKILGEYSVSELLNVGTKTALRPVEVNGTKGFFHYFFNDADNEPAALIESEGGGNFIYHATKVKFLDRS